MRERGGESGRRDNNCRAIIVGSLEFEGSTDFGKDKEFKAGMGLGSYSRTFWASAITSPKTAIDRYSYCPWIITKRVACCDKSKKRHQKGSAYMTDLRTHVYSKFDLSSGVCNSCWDQCILQLRFLTAKANKRRVKINIEKKGLRFSRSWKKWAMIDGCQKIERTQQRQGTDWMGGRLCGKELLKIPLQAKEIR